MSLGLSKPVCSLWFCEADASKSEFFASFGLADTSQVFDKSYVAALPFFDYSSGSRTWGTKYSEMAKRQLICSHRSHIFFLMFNAIFKHFPPFGGVNLQFLIRICRCL